MRRRTLDRSQFEFLLDLFAWYREHGLAPREAFIEACEDYVFVYGTGEEPRGILSASEVTELKEVRPTKQ